MIELQQLAVGLIAGLAAALPLGGARQFDAMPWFGKIGHPPAAVTAALLLGILIAAAIWVRRELAAGAVGALHMARSRRSAERRWLLTLLAGLCAPVAVSVLSAIPGAAASPPWPTPGLRPFALALAGLGIMFLMVDLVALRVRRIDHLHWAEALIAGILAAAGHWLGLGAVAPALIGLRLVGAEREAALRLAVLVGLPALATAGARQIAMAEPFERWPSAWEAAACALALTSGLAVVHGLGRWVVRRSFLPLALAVSISGATLSAGAFLLPGLFR